MKILITGTSCGIGKACAELFLQMNHEVIGFDIKDSSIQNKNYTHFTVDIFQKDSLPDLSEIEIL
ncbi:MAG: SDR family NAD(P)-dependent oxidoreductase, partial [Spirochaetaceae bacterium]|nr:SDR family NAD(P)-dependent oxidoreductase [Spirochaetaceae bacterium]